MALRLRQSELSAKIAYGPVLKAKIMSALNGTVNLIKIILSSHDFLLRYSNFGNLQAAFRAIFGHIFTAHAQK